MDELIGFLFGAFFVIAIAVFILIGIITALLNLYVLLDPVLGGLVFFPAPLAWGLTSMVTVALLHFTCAEAPELRRPGLRKVLIWVVIGWLGGAWLIGTAGG